MKKVLIIVFSLLFIILLSVGIYYYVLFKNNVVVLAYHDVLNSVSVDTDIETKKFEEQMKHLSKHNKVISIDDFYDWKVNNKKINGKKVVVTFDDGKEGVYINALPILEKYNIPATIFIIESKIDTEGYLTSDEINYIKDSHPLISLQSHSVNLHNEENAKSDIFDIYNEDMKLSKEKNYNYFAYPYGYSNDNYIKSLKDNDYKLAFKFSPSKWVNKKDDNYLLGRVPIYNSNSKFKFILKLYVKK